MTAKKVQRHHKTTTEWIPLQEIYVDPRGQRPFDVAWAKKIAAELDPDALGHPFVAELTDRAGAIPEPPWVAALENLPAMNGQARRYHAVDGQHRIAAIAMALGVDQSVPCELARGVTIAEAAALFLLRNRTRGVKALHKHLTAVTGMQPEAIAIEDVLGTLGLSVSPTRGESVVQATTALYRIYRHATSRRAAKANPELLRQTLAIATQAWGRGPDSYNGEVLLGCAFFLARYGDAINPDELTHKLQSVPPLRLHGNAQILKSTTSSTLPNAIAECLVGLYNKGRRSRTLADWKRSAE